MSTSHSKKQLYPRHSLQCSLFLNGSCTVRRFACHSVCRISSLPLSVSPLLAGPDSRVNREHQLQLDFLGAALSMITYPLRRRSGSRTSLLSCVFGAATGTGWQAI